MKTALIIHGHFYQPPRENPDTGIIEDQDSAYPYKNWNEAIYQTCYRPNAFSRYLDSRGKIEDISNNYERISANFGSTLLNWIDYEHPSFITKLLDADRKSMKALGHSNFIAQCYNHTILPLDRVGIKKIEIAWALMDYKKRFGHPSEGFWCSECAIDKETVDELFNAGVKFVVLSPWQATKINGKSLNGNPAPCDRPFTIKGNKHSIAAFFYDPDLASGISFGHYLTDADRLYNHLKDMRHARKNPSLITCATDGEIYGHHEAFGDMALSALIKKVDSGDDFYITNYGAYLACNPPKDEATLFDGKNHQGSSWSCCHGVERWISDCGCHTGGPDNWNQKWRGPLRQALNNLETKASSIITKYIKSVFGKEADFTDLMIDYGHVVIKEKTCGEFLHELSARFGIILSPDEKRMLAVLFDSYRYILYSFTSCGWFFNDICGIEPKQNITYAVNAARKIQKYTGIFLKKHLIEDLDSAKSNISSKGTGGDIAKKCFDNEPGESLACYFFILNRTEKSYERMKDTYGVFHLRSISESYINLENPVTTEIFRFAYSVSDNGSSILISLRNIENGFIYSKTFEKNNLVSKPNHNAVLSNITVGFAKEIFSNGVNDSQLAMMISTIDHLRSEGFEPDITEIQNVIHPYITGVKKSDISDQMRKILIEKLNFSYSYF